ncbi:MAG TPA: hypothetical protein ENH84_07440 [Phycisphaerae bacterium]|nr:hypothetical protein [Phycisphaerae bacterium]
MSKFNKMLSVVTCFCVMSSPAWARTPTEETTRFFETHKNAIDLKKRGDSVLFANRQIGLELKRSPRGFQLVRVYGIADNQDFQTRLTNFRNLFEIRMTLDPKFVRRDDRGKTRLGHFVILEQMAGKDAFVIGANEAKTVSWRREDNPTESVLHLTWRGIDVRENKGAMDVEVTVTLRAGDPLSYWRINIRNRSGKYGIERVRFPIVHLAPIGKAEDDLLLYPRYRGGLIDKPFKDGHNDMEFYPHNFNMQFQALYNKKTNSGVYLGTFDPAASFMCFEFRRSDNAILWRPTHFPPNITFASEDFNLPYDCVIGPLQGDWYDAAQIYRKWAVKQFWCRKGKLSVRKDIPKWYKEAPLYLYAQLGDSAAGTHSLEKNLPIAEKHFLEFLKWADGVKLPCNFYQVTERIPGLTSYDLPICVYRAPRLGRWAGFSTHETHCGNYPKIPVLPGLSAAMGRLKKAGGMVCPYLPLEFFDPGPSENAPYAAAARPHALRDLYGAFRGWGTNPNWQMCPWSDWWRNRLKETCELMLERENVSGFYLDVLQGSSLPCYWTPHGHTAAGGDSMTKGMHELVKIITNAVKTKDSEAIITGENTSENMIDVTDGILQVTLWPENTAPIFATVYQDYILRYGLEMSVSGDAFFIQSASMFVEGMQVGRLRLRPRSSALSFQNPKHKKMLDFLKLMVDYYKQDVAKKFLVYGRLLRPLTFGTPAPMPMLSYGRKGRFPALMSGVFRSDDGELGVFVVNTSTKKLSFEATLNPTEYGMAPSAAIAVETITPGGVSANIRAKTRGPVTLKGTLDAHGLTMFRLK